MGYVPNFTTIRATVRCFGRQHQVIKDRLCHEEKKYLEPLVVWSVGKNGKTVLLETTPRLLACHGVALTLLGLSRADFKLEPF